jgi:cytochrome oxidase assembly protein ShyY1
MRIGRRTFAPSWLATAITLALCVGFLSLGRWQWNRGMMRQAQTEEFSRGAEQPLPLGSHGLDEIARFRRISVPGNFDTRHQFLLDNRTHEGMPGYEVLTPLDLTDGRTVLVNRGWLPFTGYRDRLPNVAFAAGNPERMVTGRVDELPAAGLPSGRAVPGLDGHWPKVTSFPDTAQLSAALGRRIEPRIVLLDEGAPNGYVRHWQPPGLTPMRHWSYAVQWWSFALATLVLWFAVSLRKEPEPA